MGKGKGKGKGKAGGWTGKVEGQELVGGGREGKEWGREGRDLPLCNDIELMICLYILQHVLCSAMNYSRQCSRQVSLLISFGFFSP